MAYLVVPLAEQAPHYELQFARQTLGGFARSSAGDAFTRGLGWLTSRPLVRGVSNALQRSGIPAALEAVERTGAELGEAGARRVGGSLAQGAEQSAARRAALDAARNGMTQAANPPINAGRAETAAGGAGRLVGDTVENLDLMTKSGKGGATSWPKCHSRHGHRNGHRGRPRHSGPPIATLQFSGPLYSPISGVIARDGRRDQTARPHRPQLR